MNNELIKILISYNHENKQLIKNVKRIEMEKKKKTNG